MAAETTVIAIDTNLLVYAHRAAAPQHSMARKALEKAFHDTRGCGISLPCVTEFWSVVTHPSAADGPSTPALAHKFIRSLVEQAQVQIWLPSDGFAHRFLQSAANLAVVGPRVFDLLIGMIALEHGADEIWTHDRNFLKLPGLRVFDPLA
ncbi:MAG: PIN domain-containing protein [Tepidisphaeraceae bacterium]